METISIQLKQLTTEPNYTPQTTTHSDRNAIPQESYYELMRDAPDKYLSDTIQTPSTHTDDPPDIHHPSNISCNEQKQPLLDQDITNHIQFDQERNLSYLSMSTSLTLKRKRHMYYMPMDFEKLTLDLLIDTGAMTSAISEQDLNKIKLIANEARKYTGPPPNFQIMVVNGQLEVPIGTVLLEFEVADFMLRENFMKNLPNPLIGLLSAETIAVTQGILTFPYLSIQLKPDTQVTMRQATPLFAENTYTLQPGETLAIASRKPYLLDHDATGIVTHSPQFESHDSILITSSISTDQCYRVPNNQPLKTSYTIICDPSSRFQNPHTRTNQAHTTRRSSDVVIHDTT